MARRVLLASRRFLVLGGAICISPTMSLFAASSPAPLRTRLLDDLFDDKRYASIVDAAAPTESDDEVLWRLARACRFLAMDATAPLAQRKEFAERGLAYAKRAVECNKENWAAQKWLGIMYSVAGEHKSTKEQLQNAFTIRACFDRALQLNPRDATTAHLIGVWCTYFASMSYATRGIASLLFASPPSSTREEALRYLLLAEELEPGFYKTNAWCIAKTYYAMGDRAKYAEWKKRAEAMPTMDLDDERSTKEMADWK